MKNEILFSIDVGDFEKITFKKNAEYFFIEGLKFVPTVKEVAFLFPKIPPALILSLINRESRFGKYLDRDGWGDRGNAYGVLQVDKRFHNIVTADGPSGLMHIIQAVGILNKNLEQLQEKNPEWTPAEQLAGAVVAYNSGLKNVRTRPDSVQKWIQLDRGTTQNNYSRDVWVGAQYFSEKINWEEDDDEKRV